jgi:hypothetical protein
MILRKDFSPSKNATDDQRAGIPGLQQHTWRVPTLQAGMGIVHNVAGGQTSMQRTRYIEPVDGETFFQSFQQGCGGLGIIVLQPIGDLAKLGDAILRVHLPSRAYQRPSLRLLLARKSPEHVAKVVISAPLYQSSGAEHRVYRRARSFRTIDDEQAPKRRIDSRVRAGVEAGPWSAPVAASTHCSPKCMPSM